MARSARIVVFFITLALWGSVQLLGRPACAHDEVFYFSRWAPHCR